VDRPVAAEPASAVQTASALRPWRWRRPAAERPSVAASVPDAVATQRLARHWTDLRRGLSPQGFDGLPDLGAESGPVAWAEQGIMVALAELEGGQALGDQLLGGPRGGRAGRSLPDAAPSAAGVVVQALAQVLEVGLRVSTARRATSCTGVVVLAEIERVVRIARDDVQVHRNAEFSGRTAWPPCTGSRRRIQRFAAVVERPVAAPRAAKVDRVFIMAVPVGHVQGLDKRKCGSARLLPLKAAGCGEQRRPCGKPSGTLRRFGRARQIVADGLVAQVEYTGIQPCWSACCWIAA